MNPKDKKHQVKYSKVLHNKIAPSSNKTKIVQRNKNMDESMFHIKEKWEDSTYIGGNIVILIWKILPT